MRIKNLYSKIINAADLMTLYIFATARHLQSDPARHDCTGN